MKAPFGALYVSCKEERSCAPVLPLKQVEQVNSERACTRARASPVTQDAVPLLWFPRVDGNWLQSLVSRGAWRLYAHPVGGVLLPPGSSGAYLPPGCVQTHSAVLPVLEKQVGLTPLHRPACCVAAGGVSGTDGSYTIRTQISAWCEQREVPWRLCSPPDLTTPSPPHFLNKH